MQNKYMHNMQVLNSSKFETQERTEKAREADTLEAWQVSCLVLSICRGCCGNKRKLMASKDLMLSVLWCSLPPLCTHVLNIAGPDWW